MPKDVRFPSKKRHYPDGFLLASPASKKPLSISEGEPGSSIDSARRNLTIPPERLSDSAHGSLWNSASAVITSDCSASVSVGHSSTFTNLVSSKHPHFDRTSWQAPSDAASNNMEALQSARGLPCEASQKDVWVYRAPDSDNFTGSEYSEVTYARASEQSKVGSELGKATHIISRREKSNLNPNWDMDAVWFKDSCGPDTMLRQKQRECNSALLNTSESREFRSMATASSSSCGTNDSFMKEIRTRQGFSHTHGSIDKDSFAASSNVHVRVEGFVGPPAIQERSGSFGYLNTRHSSTKVESVSPSLSTSKVDDTSPSYVLSSGRLSLEEEARMGRRASTIDHDFEEYFSSLMLE